MQFSAVPILLLSSVQSLQPRQICTYTNLSVLPCLYSLNLIAPPSCVVYNPIPCRFAPGNLNKPADIVTKLNHKNQRASTPIHQAQSPLFRRRFHRFFFIRFGRLLTGDHLFESPAKYPRFCKRVHDLFIGFIRHLIKPIINLIDIEIHRAT